MEGDRGEYFCDVNPYTEMPNLEMSLHMLEKICLDRLELYKIMYRATCDFRICGKSWIKFVLSQLDEKNLVNLLKLFDSNVVREYCDGLTRAGCIATKKKSRMFDHVGHFLLLFVYCETEELRDFYLKREFEWFTLRYILQTPENKEKFLSTHKLNYEKVSDEEKELLKNELLASCNVSDNDFQNAVFLKAEFFKVPLVTSIRQAFLKKGIAYFTSSHMLGGLQKKLLPIWHGHLKAMHQRLTLCPEDPDDRIMHLVRGLPKVTEGTIFRSVDVDNVINLKNVDVHAKVHFPLCMKHLHQQLRANHHLKHDARLQYGIFLKWAGMPFEEAMTFWREEFQKKMTAKEFVTNKYEYYFKHQYGKVGGKIQYESPSCQSIIENTPSPGQQHGCPFAHFDSERLSETLSANGVGPDVVNQIVELKRGKQCQQACRLYFSAVRNKTPSHFTNPNQYYYQSVEIKDIEDLVCRSSALQIFEDETE